MRSFLLLTLLASASLTQLPHRPAEPVQIRMATGGLRLSDDGYQLILDYEVGGGKPYYVRCLQRPEWPGGASGVTIGVGYDLGYNTRAQIARDWAELGPGVVARLQECSGLTGSAARLKLRSTRDLVVPWDAAIRVYEERTLPRFAAATVRAYPGIQTLHPHIQSAMLSWVFNRGEGISPSSARDLEKRQLRADIPGHPATPPPCPPTSAPASASGPAPASPACSNAAKPKPASSNPLSNNSFGDRVPTTSKLNRKDAKDAKEEALGKAGPVSRLQRFYDFPSRLLRTSGPSPSLSSSTSHLPLFTLHLARFCSAPLPSPRLFP